MLYSMKRLAATAVDGGKVPLNPRFARRQLAAAGIAATVVAALLIGGSATADASPASLRTYSCVPGGLLHLYTGNRYQGTGCAAVTSTDRTICWTVPNVTYYSADNQADFTMKVWSDTTCSGTPTYINGGNSNPAVVVRSYARY
jgi:hypothetical protein